MCHNYCDIIINKGIFMNTFELPIDGEIDYNPNVKLKVRLRKDENNSLKLELLNRFEDYWGFGMQTLKCKFKGHIHNYNVTFLNCDKTAGITSPCIEFSSYISYTNFEDDKDLTFIDVDTPREKVCFKIKDLDKWLYPHFNISKNQQISFIDENNMELKGKKNAKYVKIKIFNKSINCKFKYLNEQFVLSIIDELDGHSIKFPKIEIYPYCYIELKGEKAHHIIFYKKLINKIKKLFSLFFNQIAQITSLYEFKKFKYRIDYKIFKECNECFFNSDNNIFYDYVKDDLGTIIEKWLSFYDEYELIINSICNYNYSTILSDNINKKAQLLETYGNIITKGQNTRTDIKSALLDLSKDNFEKIFHINSIEQDWITYELDLRDFSSEYEEQINKLSEQIMNLRNYFTHPYKNGSLKLPKYSNISIHFANDDQLNKKAIHILDICLEEVLIILLLQKLGIDKYYKKID